MPQIDLKSKEGRKSFTSDNLSDLLSGINDTYGPIMLEELLKRIEHTINEFNLEVTNAFDTLKDKDQKRQEIYDKMKSSEKENDLKENNHEQTEWELKLEEIESSTK